MSKPIITTLSQISPMLIQKYERYLPTAFDESFTLLEKLNKVIVYLNQIGELTNNVVDQWNQVMEWVINEGIEDAVNQKLDEMVEDGTLDQIINHNLFGEFNRRLDDLAINVKSFPTYQDAITFAYENKRILDWGNDDHNVSSNLLNFHDVEHIGKGSIIKNNNNFYLSPFGEKENKIYVDYANGVDTNDGLSNTSPLRTIQRAFDVLALHARPILKGFWKVIISSGNYDVARMKENLPSENKIIIEGANVGGHPVVPTTVITEGTGISKMGLRFDGNVKVTIKNIKLVGFNGTTSSAGINCANGVDLNTENVHTDSCYYGISGQKSNIEIPDGIHENNGKLPNGGGSGAAIRSLQLNRHHVGIQNKGNRSLTAIFRNNKAGVYAQESSTGHVDWCVFEDNEDHILLRVNSRANIDGSSFVRGYRAVRAEGNCHVYVSNNVEFGVGSNEVASPLVLSSGSQLTSDRLFGNSKDISYATNERSFDIRYLNKSISNSSNDLFHYVTLKYPFWRNLTMTTAPIKKIRFIVNGVIAGSNGVKRFNVRLGNGLIQATFGASEQGDFRIEGEIYFAENGKQVMSLISYRHLLDTRLSQTIATNDLTIDTDLRFEGQTDAQDLDSITVNTLELIYAG